MKKFLLGLFLMLGVVSLALPNYVDGEKIKKAGYEIMESGDRGFRISKESNEDSTLILYYLDNSGKSSAKIMSETSVETAPKDLKFLSSTENKIAYINEFTRQKGYSAYSIVGKKTKLKNCYLVIFYFNAKKLSNAELAKVSEGLLNEGESFLK